MISPHEMPFEFNCRHAVKIKVHSVWFTKSIYRVCKQIQLTNIIFVFRVSAVHHFQQLYLDLRLIEERFLVLDDLNGNVHLVFVIEGLHHLTETSFACILNESNTEWIGVCSVLVTSESNITDQRINFVAIQKLFTVLDDVVVVVIVVAIVVQFALLFV